MSTPVTSTTPRQIALRQGLLFGGSLGVLILIGAVLLVVLSAFHFSFSAVSVFPYAFGLTYLLALIAFFFAGWRSAQRTGRVDIGALAGLWAGLVAALVGALVYIVLIIASYGEYRYATSSRSLAALIVSVVFTTTRNAIWRFFLVLVSGPLAVLLAKSMRVGQQLLHQYSHLLSLRSQNLLRPHRHLRHNKLSC